MSQPPQYHVLATQPQKAELEVKRSQFIALAYRVANTAEAKAQLSAVKEAYPDARHHCYAFIAGAPTDSQAYGYSDDGEPSGTAGKPIFSRLQHSGVGEILVVVVRYFGGTKLGTGGLARAYGDVTSQLFDQLQTEPYVAMDERQISVSFAREGDIRRAIEAVQGSVLAEEYSSLVTLTVRVPTGTQLPLLHDEIERKA